MYLIIHKKTASFPAVFLPKNLAFELIGENITQSFGLSVTD